MKYTKEQLQTFVDLSETISDVLRKLGLNAKSGNNYKRIKLNLAEYGIDTSHFKDKRRTRLNKRTDFSDMIDKKCFRCEKTLSLTAFKSNTNRPDGLQGQCVDCQKEYRRKHYLKNRDKYIEKSKKWRLEFVSWWKEYKKQFKCLRCGESHPACIDFHHFSDDKDNCVSVLVSMANKDRLLKEIEKCEPLCSNCHRKIHWRE